MANIKIKKKHGLTRETARASVDAVAKELKKKLKAQYAWRGDSLKFKRSGASGSIDVGDDFVKVDIKLGLALSPMKGTIERAIRKNLSEALDDRSTKTA